MSRTRNPKATRHGTGETRIIGGRWRSRRLVIVDRPDLRPTPDRLRETLFNWLGQDLADSHCLDLFCGSGALGLEALSRGAQSATFIDSDRHVINSLQQVVRRFDCTSQTSLIADDALRFLTTEGQRFNIVFADPPFHGDDLTTLVTALAHSRRLSPTAFVFIEHHRETPLPTLPDNWTLYRSSSVGVSNGSLLLVDSTPAD